MLPSQRITGKLSLQLGQSSPLTLQWNPGYYTAPTETNGHSVVERPNDTHHKHHDSTTSKMIGNNNNKYLIIT